MLLKEELKMIKISQVARWGEDKIKIGIKVVVIRINSN